MPPTNVGHDYYEILGIFHDAQPATVKLAYKRLALARHPDRRKNEPGATADFQLLSEAYGELSDIHKRQEYDKLYHSTILPGKIKSEKIAELEDRLRQLVHKREGPKTLLCNIKKDLIRLYAERDSVKGEKERILKERATETWWSYISSLMIGNTVEFNQRRQRREREITDSIGKQRTKEWNIDLKLAEVQSLEGMLDSISSAEIEIKVKIAKIEERWRKRLSLQEMERALAKWKNQR